MVNAYPQAIQHIIEDFRSVPTSPYVKNYTDDRKQTLIKLMHQHVKGDVKLLKFNQSLCPGCVDEEKWDGMKIDCLVYVKDNKVWMIKQCQEHGAVKELYWSDYEMYKKAERFQDPGIKILNPNIDKSEFEIDCPSDCGLCVEHESHTGLGNIVLTNICDLTCWYCLPYEEELPVKISGQVKIMKIGELVEAGMSKNSSKIDGLEGFFSVPESGMEVLTFEDGKASWAKISKLLKRKYKGKFIKVKTSTGKKITTTADHRFAVISDKFQKKAAGEINGENILTISNIQNNDALEEIDLFETLKELSEDEATSVYVHHVGDVFAALQKKGDIKDFFPEKSHFYAWKHRDSMPLSVYRKVLPQSGVQPNGISFGVDAKQYEMGRKLRITNELAKLVGYFVADGHYSKQNIWFTCEDEFVRNDIISCLETLGLKYSIINTEKKATQINVGNKILALAFKSLGIKPGAANKRLPSFIFSSPKDVRISCLSGLFNGDGFVTRGERHASMGYASVSEGLIRDVNYLLDTVGIFSRRHKASMESNPLANHSFIGKLNISGQHMQNLASLLELKPTHKQRLEGLSERRGVRIDFLGDFALDSMSEIEVVEAEEQFVYDIEVESKSHTFVAGDGILVSNCFFYAKEGEPVYEPTMDQIKLMLNRMRDEKPVGANAVQLTGGEPTLREDIGEIIKAAREIGYEHVQLNTNGINLSKSLELCQKIKDAGSHVLYLSFDGVTPQTNPKNYWEATGAIENCKKAGLGIVLVPTVIGGVNDHELGDIIRFGMKNIGTVRAVNFQPVSLVGRMPDRLRKKQRITIPGAIKRIEEQTDGQIGKEHWFPVPCAKQITDFIEALKEEPKYRLSIHFACGMATYAFKSGDRIVTLPEFFDVEGFFEYLAELTKEINNSKMKSIRKPWTLAKLAYNIRKYVDNEKKPKELKFVKMLTGAMRGGNYHGLADLHHNSLFIGMMHFQDPHNWDIDRIHKCDIHYASPDGRVLPFCTFNVIPALYRDKLQNKYSMPPAEWEAKTGKKISSFKHHRSLTPEQMKAIKLEFDSCRRTMTKPQIEADWGDEDAETIASNGAARANEPMIAGAAKFGAAAKPAAACVACGPVLQANDGIIYQGHEEEVDEATAAEFQKQLQEAAKPAHKEEFDMNEGCCSDKKETSHSHGNDHVCACKANGLTSGSCGGGGCSSHEAEEKSHGGCGSC